MDLKGILEQAISERDGLTGLKVEEVIESPGSKPGDNYMSVVSRAVVRGVTSAGEPFSKWLFIKRPVNNQEYGEVFRVKDAFHNEATTYLKMFPLYDSTMPCARCYYADCDLIVLEDLLCEGYTMGERCKGFDLQTSRHVVQALAKFHAASYHANVTKRAEFTDVARLLKVIGINTSGNSTMLEGLLSRVHSQIAEDPDFISVVDYIKPLHGNVQETMKALRKPGTIEVLSHGDFWINNILVVSGDDEPVRVVDLQASALTSPAVDVWSFLYTSLELAVMNNHLEELLHLYCTYFVDELTSLHLPQNRVPSEEDVLEDLNSRELYGFLIANLYLPALSVDSESLQNIETVSKEDIMKETFMANMQFPGMKERLIQLISICRRRGVFARPFQLDNTKSKLR